MLCIYCIKNKINGKCYIGKTTKSIEERFKEHCLDSKRARYEIRPLYRAFNKYGIENFEISLLCECNNVDELSQKEIYYINEYNTFHNGYNATKGGDGSVLYDYDEIVTLYQSGLNMK